MRKIQFLTTLIAACSILLGACGNASISQDGPMSTATPSETMIITPTEESIPNDTLTPEAGMETPEWFGASLTDVRTGQSFSINELKGKVILVETMAQWCSNCLRQQGEVKALHDKIGENDDFVSIGLDIDPNENAADLKSYVEAKGFDWLYAVPTADVSREIANLYGAQFLNPPSTPILIVDRQGIAHPLRFGIKSVDELFEAVNMYLQEGL